MRAILCWAALALIGLGAAQARAADPSGTWLNDDKDGIIQIASCGGGALCGRVVWIKNALDPATGKPPVDKNNGNPALRNRPILGLQVLSQMRPSTTPNRWTGRVYSIDDGKSFDGRLTLLSNNQLRVEGCVLIACQGETWTRTAGPRP